MTVRSAAASGPGGTLGVGGTRGGGLRQVWRAFWTSARLGWQIESNWADPLVFFIYACAKPVGGALILVFMLEVISGGRADTAFRAFVVIGSALWSFVMAGIAGLTWSVLDDRERYRVLKYLYVSPNALLVMLLGRGLARVAIGGFGAIITLAIGIAFLGVPFDAMRVDWLALAISMVLGLTSIIALAIVLASIAMQTRQDAWHYPEAVAGALFLVAGAVFPLSVLPPFAQLAGLVTPLTWWLETVRVALFPDIVTAIGGPGSFYASIAGRAAPSLAEGLVLLLLTTAVATLAAVAAYRWSEHRAKERGLFDLITGS
jgi:ABC-2 type transport system permease protein